MPWRFWGVHRHLVVSDADRSGADHLRAGAAGPDRHGADAGRAFSQAFGGFGPVFIAVCMFFFAFSTIIGWYFFGQSNFKALFGEKLLPVYSVIVVAFILVGSTLKVDLVWALADLFNGLMAIRTCWRCWHCPAWLWRSTGVIFM